MTQEQRKEAQRAIIAACLRLAVQSDEDIKNQDSFLSAEDISSREKNIMLRKHYGSPVPLFKKFSGEFLENLCPKNLSPFNHILARLSESDHYEFGMNMYRALYQYSVFNKVKYLDECVLHLHRLMQGGNSSERPLLEFRESSWVALKNAALAAAHVAFPMPITIKKGVGGNPRTRVKVVDPDQGALFQGPEEKHDGLAVDSQTKASVSALSVVQDQAGHQYSRNFVFEAWNSFLDDFIIVVRQKFEMLGGQMIASGTAEEQVNEVSGKKDAAAA